MNNKKYIFFGICLILIIGCILAAGCTSTNTSEQRDYYDTLAGAWMIKDGNSADIIVLENDGTGYTEVLADEEFTRLQNYSPLTWKAESDGSLVLKVDKVRNPYSMKYNAETGTIVNGEGRDIVKMDPITGTWFTKAYEMDSNRFESTVLKPNGTGYQSHISEDGEVYVYKFNWKNNGDNSYDIVFTDGEEAVYYLNDAKDTINCSYGFTFTKEFADSYYYIPVLGPWYNEELNQSVTFGSDSYGIMRKSDGTILQFTWSVPDFESILIHWVTGDSSGKDELWKYDGEKSALISSGNLKYFRPDGSIDGISIEID